MPAVKAKIKQKRESGAYDNMVKRMKDTLKEKYGDENYNNVEKGKRTKLEKYDCDLSEWQNMQLNGYDRIWDCGHFKYEWFIN